MSINIFYTMYGFAVDYSKELEDLADNHNLSFIPTNPMDDGKYIIGEILCKCNDDDEIDQGLTNVKIRKSTYFIKLAEILKSSGVINTNESAKFYCFTQTS